MKRIDELTGLRCIAVSMVVIEHSVSQMPALMAHWTPKGWGDTGVLIFFVLSGFLITSLLQSERARSGSISLKAFYWRRTLRIMPAFYAYIGVIAILTGLGLLNVSWQQATLAGTYLWNYAHLLGLDHSFASHAQGAWMLGHTWSLSLEEQFYWIWPAAMLWLLRPGRTWPLTAAVLGVPLLRMFSYAAFPNIRGQLDLMFHTGSDAILVGCYFALHRHSLEQKLQGWIQAPATLNALAFSLAIVAPLLTEYLRGYWSATYGRTVEAAAVGLLFLCLLAQPQHWLSRLLRTRVFLFMGTISYSLYLWQQLFCTTDTPARLPYPLNVGAAVLAACASYWLIEKPFLRLKDRLHAPRSATAPH